MGAGVEVGAEVGAGAVVEVLEDEQEPRRLGVAGPVLAADRGVDRGDVDGDRVAGVGAGALLGGGGQGAGARPVLDRGRPGAVAAFSARLLKAMTRK